jgi:hypothetical protein
MRNDTLVASMIDSATDFGSDERRQALAERGLARAHDDYIRGWKQRLAAALRVSPVSAPYVR